MPRLTARERREAYLREYAYQKRTGKAFFPYALFHDVVMNFFFVALIVVLACVWYYTAGHGHDLNHGGKSGVLGPLYEDRADPAVESYDPRPEWYYYFLFELLRLFSNPNLILFGTIIVPTLFMVLLIAMPFLDRSRERRLSRRPIAISYASGMAVLLLALTWYGSKAPGAGGAVTGAVAGKLANLQCTTCHTLKETGWNASGPGPNLDSAHPNYQLATDRITNGKGGMPSFKSTFTKDQIACIATFVSTVSNGGTEQKAAGGAPKSPAQACASFKP
jgi:menaquinol-cytochrome c reductase cytochrome b/c subunit